MGNTIQALARAAFMLSIGFGFLGASAGRALSQVRSGTHGYLPVPPLQQSTWSPPAGDVPQSVVREAARLFELGFADPRGCQYRALVVPVGSSSWGFYGQYPVHGWLLPGDRARRFAVCWNGLIYPVVSIGPYAELERDVLATVEPVERWVRNKPPSDVLELYPQFAVTESRAVFEHQLEPVRTCLLLRIGEGTLAARMWRACAAKQLCDPSGQDPLLLPDWEWYIYDRALGAHARSADFLALSDASLLTSILEHLTQASAVRPTKGSRPNSLVREFGTAPRRLLIDAERRLRERSEPSDRRVHPWLPQQVRIVRLIRNLDEVSVTQNDQPGSVHLGDAIQVRGLVREGDVAVPALLECLERDDRLTRSIEFDRNFSTERHVLTVRHAALEAVVSILRTDQFPSLEDRGREVDWRKLVPELRSYWERYGSLPPSERWYRTLADDSASPAQWLEAAASITAPSAIESSPVRSSPLDRFFFGDGRIDTSQGPVRGEPLRRRVAPSVAELLRRRVGEVVRMGSPAQDRSWDAINLTLCLARWDRHGAAQTLREQFVRCVGLTGGSPAGSTGFDSAKNASYLILLTEQRKRAHDPKALPDFLRWMRSDRPAFPTSPASVFEPLCEQPADPAVTATAAQIFLSPSSHWKPEVVRQSLEEEGGRNPMVTPVFGLPAFRRLVYELLADRSSAGTVSVGPRGEAEFRLNQPAGANDPSGAVGALPQTRQGRKVLAARVCEVVTWRLSAIPGSPVFDFNWSAVGRNRAVLKMSRFVRRYGPSMVASSSQLLLNGWRSSGAVAPTYPRLVRPAGQGDVFAGRAVFTLGTGAPVRVVNLSEVPSSARWLKLKKYPYPKRDWDDGIPSYIQDGWVWQSEEVLRNGRWERFYGFVGPHEIVRVPAREIEFRPEDGTGWDRLSDGWDCSLRLRGHAPMWAGDPAEYGMPVLDLWVRNRAGLPQTLRLPKPGRLPPGVSIRATRWPWLSADGTRPLSALEIPHPPSPPDVRGPGITNDRSQRIVLQPGAQYRLCRLPLARWYASGRPAQCRVSVAWRKRDGAIADGESSWMSFVVESAAAR